MEGVKANMLHSSNHTVELQATLTGIHIFISFRPAILFLFITKTRIGTECKCVAHPFPRNTTDIAPMVRASCRKLRYNFSFTTYMEECTSCLSGRRYKSC